jgi:hypothetical protein
MQCWDEYFALGILYHWRTVSPDQLPWLIDSIDKFPLVEMPIDGLPPYPTDIRERVRFNLGVLLADQGLATEARSQMKILANQRPAQTSQWIEAAKTFLEKYRQPTDFINACMATHLCASNLDLSQFISHIPVDQAKEIGTILSSSGYSAEKIQNKDIDGDGIAEIWFVNKEEMGNNLWIVKVADGKLQAVSTSLSSTTNIFTVQARDAIEGNPVFLVQHDQENETWVLTTDLPAKKLESALLKSWLQFYIQNALSPIEDQLLSGSDPNLMIDQLTHLEYLVKMDQTIKTDPCAECAHWKYLLALADELAGNKTQAARLYYELWRDYPNSPFVLMAKAKLDSLPQ